MVLFYQFYDVRKLEFQLSKDFCFVDSRFLIKTDKTIVSSPQEECSAFGTDVIPSHGASAEQLVASPGVDFVSFPVHISHTNPFR